MILLIKINLSIFIDFDKLNIYFIYIELNVLLIN